RVGRFKVGGVSVSIMRQAEGGILALASSSISNPNLPLDFLESNGRKSPAVILEISKESFPGIQEFGGFLIHSPSKKSDRSFELFISRKSIFDEIIIDFLWLRSFFSGCVYGLPISFV